MIHDHTPRWLKALDALSQFANVALLPRHRDTTSNESISGRAHREGWACERLIDALFFWERNPRHCEASYQADLIRARNLIESHSRRKP